MATTCRNVSFQNNENQKINKNKTKALLTRHAAPRPREAIPRKRDVFGFDFFFRRKVQRVFRKI